jgi:uncharacterized RDD family membrane protein YckC
MFKRSDVGGSVEIVPDTVSVIKVRYAGFWVRLLAYIIDAVIGSICIVIIIITILGCPHQAVSSL